MFSIYLIGLLALGVCDPSWPIVYGGAQAAGLSRSHVSDPRQAVSWMQRSGCSFTRRVGAGFFLRWFAFICDQIIIKENRRIRSRHAELCTYEQSYEQHLIQRYNYRHIDQEFSSFTMCTRNIDPFHIVRYYLDWTFWTYHSTSRGMI